LANRTLRGKGKTRDKATPCLGLRNSTVDCRRIGSFDSFGNQIAAADVLSTARRATLEAMRAGHYSPGGIAFDNFSHDFHTDIGRTNP